MIPLYRFLKSPLSQDVLAVASFSCDIAAMLDKVYIISLFCKWCFHKEAYEFRNVLQQHTTEISTFSEEWLKIKFSVMGI
jgi:uncharacterized membrane protein